MRTMCNNKHCMNGGYREDASNICPFCLDSLIRKMGHGYTFDLIMRLLYEEGISDAIDMLKKLDVIDRTNTIKKLLEMRGKLS